MAIATSAHFFNAAFNDSLTSSLLRFVPLIVIFFSTPSTTVTISSVRVTSLPSQARKTSTAAVTAPADPSATMMSTSPPFCPATGITSFRTSPTFAFKLPSNVSTCATHRASLAS
ncbi:hypothetical protein CMV30_04075 [Nibricoccus aquaticus]|uniref:Uncharacterized protein n=1 Tax=Nibricoccus aquaticus TaxID=2576891 RepID=A0A290Q4H7_9BACT|nr:hypothetical protein CMV30_04075 [Nibricoccus aquaticus]